MKAYRRGRGLEVQQAAAAGMRALAGVVCRDPSFVTHTEAACAHSVQAAVHIGGTRS